MKTVLLTGATGGIGQAIVKELKDFKIAAWYHEQEKKARQLNASSIHRCNLAVSQQIKEAFDETIKRYGCIDVLINCAGMISPSTSFEGEKNIEKVYGVNLVGPAVLTNLTYEQMRKQGQGTIINIASTAAVYNGRRASDIYKSSKIGLLGLTEALSDECQNSGIVVCAVSPGTTDTPMLDVAKDYIDRKKLSDPTFVVQSPAFVAKVIGKIARAPQNYHGLNVVVEKNKVTELKLGKV